MVASGEIATAPVASGFVLSWLPGVSLGRELPEERGARGEPAQRQERYEALARKARG